MRDDPVAWPILHSMLQKESPALITLLFQLYAINLRDITEKGKKIDKALAAGTAAWNYADGLWVGAVDFGRAFQKIVKTYMDRVQALADYCESTVSLFFTIHKNIHRIYLCVYEETTIVSIKVEYSKIAVMLRRHRAHKVEAKRILNKRCYSWRENMLVRKSPCSVLAAAQKGKKQQQEAQEGKKQQQAYKRKKQQKALFLKSQKAKKTNVYSRRLKQS